MSQALLVEEGGKTSPDPCRLYFEKRHFYYSQHVDSLDAPMPGHDTQEAAEVEHGHPGGRRARVVGLLAGSGA